MSDSIPTPSVRNPVPIEVDLPAAEAEAESEITLHFLVADLSLEAQNRFLQHLDLHGMGQPQEGRYLSLSPPKLAERIPRTATITFTVHLGPEGTKDTLEMAASDAIHDALLVAQAHGVRLLSASCPAVAEGGAA